MKRLLFLSFCLLLVVAVGVAEQPPPQEPALAEQEAEAAGTSGQQAPIFRSGINYIRVDVIARDENGNPVLDLAIDDFEVYEDGVAQEVDSFELIEVDLLPELGDDPVIPIGITRADQELAASQADVRLFVIFLDDYHVREGNGIRARRMIVDFLENDLLPTDLVGVMYPLMPLDDVRLTRNHQAVINAVSQFRGIKYNYEVRNNYEAMYNQYPTETVERIRNDVSLSALRGLMVRLGGLREGRKSVVVVSEGYTYYVPPQLRSESADMPVDPSVNPARFDPEAGDSGYETSRSFFSEAAMMQDLQRLFQTANRFNTSLYTVDPRGLAVFEFDVDQPTVSIDTNRRELRRTQDTLRMLAEETDGRAIVNQNDLRPGLEQMLSDSSSYYLLGYTSSLEATDGEFHEIDVRVKREGVRVRARPGYWAVTERDVERSLRTRVNEPPRAVDLALDALAEPRRGRLIRTLVGTTRGENGKTNVTFVWEPVQERGRRESASRVLLTAMGDNGSAYFRGRVPEQRRAGRGVASASALDGDRSSLSFVEFEVDPGNMQLSLAIEGDGGEVLDRDLAEFVIPDFTAPEVIFSTPVFVRARNAMEYREVVDDWNVQPTASRIFRRTDLLMLRFHAYAPGQAIPELEVNLLNRSGDLMFPLEVRRVDDGSAYQVELMPSFLAPAEYIVELKAETSESEATELVAFRLGS